MTLAERARLANETMRATTIALTCEICQATFETTGDRSGARYCDRPDCQRTRKRDEARRYRERHGDQIARSKQRANMGPRALEGLRRRQARALARARAEREAQSILLGPSQSKPGRKRLTAEELAARVAARAAAERERYRNDPGYRASVIESSRASYRKNPKVHIDKAQRNKARSKARDPERYRLAANRHARESEQRTIARMGRAAYSLRTWRAKIRRKLGYEPSPLLWTLLEAQRELSIADAWRPGPPG